MSNTVLTRVAGNCGTQTTTVTIAKPTQFTFTTTGDVQANIRFNGALVAALTQSQNRNTYDAHVAGDYFLEITGACELATICTTQIEPLVPIVQVGVDDVALVIDVNSDASLETLLRIEAAINAQEDFEIISTDWDRNEVTGTWTRTVTTFIDGVAQAPTLIDSGDPITGPSPDENDYIAKGVELCNADGKWQVTNIFVSTDFTTPVATIFTNPLGVVAADPGDLIACVDFPTVVCPSANIARTVTGQADNIGPLAAPLPLGGSVDGVQFAGTGGVPFTGFPWLAEGTIDNNVGMFFFARPSDADVPLECEEFQLTQISFTVTYEQFNDNQPDPIDLGDFVMTIASGTTGVPAGGSTNTVGATIFDGGSTLLVANSVNQITTVTISVDVPNDFTLQEAIDMQIGIALERDTRFNLIDVQKFIGYDVVDICPDEAVHAVECNSAATLAATLAVQTSTVSIEGLLVDVLQALNDNTSTPFTVVQDGIILDEGSPEDIFGSVGVTSVRRWGISNTSGGSLRITFASDRFIDIPSGGSYDSDDSDSNKFIDVTGIRIAIQDEPVQLSWEI